MLVLGNSLGTTRDLWEPQLAALGEHFRLLRYEHRGHGGSPAPPGPYTLADLGADVLRLLDDFGVEHASYCGVSLGGMVGMWLAANAPGRIDALAVCCTSARFPDTDLWVRRAAAVRAGGLPPLSAQVVSRWFTPDFAARHPSVPAGFAATLDGVDPEGYAGCCEAIVAMDLRPDLAAITAPTLVISRVRGPGHPALARRRHRPGDHEVPAGRHPGRLAPGQRVRPGRGDRRAQRPPARHDAPGQARANPGVPPTPPAARSLRRCGHSPRRSAGPWPRAPRPWPR